MPHLDALSGLAAVLALAALSAAAAPAPQPPTALHDRALETLKRGVAFRTVVPPGDQVPAYAAYLKGLLVAAGFAPEDVRIEPMAGTARLVARYRGRDPARKPIVVIDHMDVVEANPKDWTRDPFTPVVEHGYVFGRGAYDDKFDVSAIVTVLAKLKREGWTPGRDVVLALSGDEETQMQTGRANAVELKNAELVLNGDAGGGVLSQDGKPLYYGLQAAEKTYADFAIAVTSPGGHSSRPGKSNAIYELAADLGRLAAYRFPVMRSEITEAAFRAAAPITPGPTGAALRRYLANPKDAQAIAVLTADPDYVGQLRTTCVATMVSAGHAPNALPQRAEANVNCRISPGTPSEAVRKVIEQVIADPAARVTRKDDGSIDAPASALRPDVLAAVSAAVHARAPGLPIVPSMSAGATDSMFFRAESVPAYGVSGVFMKPSDDFAHGLDERVPLASLDGALLQWELILRELAK